MLERDRATLNALKNASDSSVWGHCIVVLLSDSHHAAIDQTVDEKSDVLITINITSK